MRRYLALVFCTVLLLAGWNATKTNGQAGNAQTHVAAAKAAAYEPGQDFTGSPFGLCAEPQPNPPAAPPAAAFAARKIPPRSQWYTEPYKVFDNLYYVGGSRQENTNMWAITTSEGIILMDSGRDYTTEELIVNGLKKMGLDPAQIKYVIVTEGEFLFYGGSKLLQDRYKARVLMSEAGWDAVAKSNIPAQFKPRKDMVVTDGQKLTLGDVTVTIYVLQGHTTGSIATVISPLKDGNQRHVGSSPGGRAPAGDEAVEGVQYYRNEIDSIRTWAAATKRFKGIAESAGADVFIAAHDSWDKTLDKLNAVKFRKPGGPHPFVSKSAVTRFQTVVSECMDAQLAWRSSK